MAGTLYIHGGGYSYKEIKDCIEAFIQRRKVVSVLFEKNPGQVLKAIKSTWLKFKEGRVIHFVVPRRGRLSDLQKKWIEESDAIFVNGGDTRLYHKLYAKGAIRDVIVKRFRSGASVGGSSAGALILARNCIVWGSRSSKNKKAFNLCCSVANAEYKANNTALKLERGIGVLKSSILEVHGSEWGRLPRLMEAMKRFRARRGIMVDEDTYLIMQSDSSSKILVKGRGRAYFVEAFKSGYLVTIRSA